MHPAKVSAANASAVRAAVAATRRAFPAWATLRAEGRLPILQRFRSHADEIAAPWTDAGPGHWRIVVSADRRGGRSIRAAAGIKVTLGP